MKKKMNLFRYLTIVVMIMFCHNIHAINRVTIVTIGGGGGEMVPAGENRDPQLLVDRIIGYWHAEFEKVLISRPDLILLTEACDRPGGLTEEEQFNYYRVRKDQVIDYFASVAKFNHCYIAFGMKRQADDGIWWNSCYLLDRSGKIAGIYNKNFPTIDEMAGGIRAGNQTTIFQCDFGRVGCAICFDLNFDELRERYAALNPDIMLFPSMYHGGLEQSKWAYSCRSFFVCSFGSLTAPSEIRNPLGEIVASSTNYFNYAIANINLDRELVHLDHNWEKLQALKTKYGNEVIIEDPGKIGVVMITSEKEGVSAGDIVKEFKMELVDDYFNRSRQERHRQIGTN
jgi:predicted amidohydrolase